MIASALIEIRTRAESLAVPPPLPRHLAFGKGFILQVRAAEAVVLNSSDGLELSRVPLKEPRAAVALPAGSVLVAALAGSYRFDPGQKRPHPASRLSLLPGFVLEPRRDSLESLWVVQAPLRKIQRYALEPDAGIGLESERVLSHYDGGPFTTLRDGSFLYTAGGGTALVRAAGSGEAKPLALPSGFAAAWRLAAADRIDRAWVATMSGDVLLIEIGARLRVVQAIRTGLRPFDFAATASRFAFVSLTERAGESRRFSLNVFTRAGTQIYSHLLAAVEVTAEADWAARASANQEVVISGEPSRIAVGGASSLRVFELESGRELFAR